VFVADEEGDGVHQEESDEHRRLLALEAAGEQGKIEEREGNRGPESQESEGSDDHGETQADESGVCEFL
jgi:hypothetical protein